MSSQLDKKFVHSDHLKLRIFALKRDKLETLGQFALKKNKHETLSLFSLKKDKHETSG